MTPETVAAYTELVQELIALREELAWVRQTVHQGYHADPENSGYLCEPKDCPKSICSAITRRLETDAPKVISMYQKQPQGRRPK